MIHNTIKMTDFYSLKQNLERRLEEQYQSCLLLEGEISCSPEKI
jgi:hypothetical protein